MEKTTIQNLKAFEDARDALIKLETLVHVLSPSEVETLEILLDREAMEIIGQGIEEAERGELIPIEQIFD